MLWIHTPKYCNVYRLSFRVWHEELITKAQQIIRNRREFQPLDQLIVSASFSDASVSLNLRFRTNYFGFYFRQLT